MVAQEEPLHPGASMSERAQREVLPGCQYWEIDLSVESGGYRCGDTAVAKWIFPGEEDDPLLVCEKHDKIVEEETRDI